MDNEKIREPKQKRSVEKKNKIIEAGCRLFTEKGYNNTNTAEIAKEAGVSTGIVYSYFKDKKDIYIAAIDYIVTSLSKPIYQMMSSLSSPDEIIENIDKIIEAGIASHNNLEKLYQGNAALEALDEDVAAAIMRCNEKIIDDAAAVVSAMGYNPPNLRERLHLIIRIMDEFIHEYSYNRAESLDYSVMQRYLADIIKAVYYAE